MESLSELLTGAWKTYVTFAAVHLRIFTILDDREMTAEELAKSANAVPHLMKALLDACAAMGLILQQDNIYCNSHFSRIYLVEGKPAYLGDIIEVFRGESGPWLNLHELIRTGRASTAQPVIAPPDTRTFIKGMNNLGLLGEAEALRNAVDLSGCRTMVDAGGGSGLYSLYLCQKYPDLRSTILDIKEAWAAAKELTAGKLGRERLQFREADITCDPFGENLDVVLLSDVIYDLSEAKLILKNAWKGMKPGGRLVIRGYYVDEQGTDPLFASLFVLNVLAFDPTREPLTLRTLSQTVKGAGFEDIYWSPLTERSHFLTARRALAG